MQRFRCCGWLQGRFLAVSGFGNLPGDIGFYEKQEDNTCTPLGAAKCVAVGPLRLVPASSHAKGPEEQ